MPWCQRCDRFLSPNTVRPDGTCPACGRAIDPVEPTVRPGGDPGTAHAQVPAPVVDDADSVTAPWHFWVMVIAAVAYLGWRGIEGVVWVVQQIF